MVGEVKGLEGDSARRGALILASTLDSSIVRPSCLVLHFAKESPCTLLIQAWLDRVNFKA